MHAKGVDGLVQARLPLQSSRFKKNVVYTSYHSVCILHKLSDTYASRFRSTYGVLGPYLAVQSLKYWATSLGVQDWPMILWPSSPRGDR
jgi:hypothetical protein